MAGREEVLDVPVEVDVGNVNSDDNATIDIIDLSLTTNR